MDYTLSIPKQGKYSGFYWSIDYIKKDRMVVGVLIGILKRHSFYCDYDSLNLGYLFINVKAIKRMVSRVL